MPAPNDDVLELWRRVVNCRVEEIEEWHTTPASSSVGTRAPGARWSVGQLAGIRTAELLAVPVAEWTAADHAHVRRVAGFVRRHRAQWPRGDVRERRWRHALRNWGHDPLWEGRLTLSALDGQGQVLVDGEPVGTLSTSAEDALVLHSLVLEESWRGRGVGSAVLHQLAVDHDGRVRAELDPTPGAADVRALLVRRHFDAPTPDSSVLTLVGW
ncbi:GNAT family N-acetyltransferase [Nocardioides daphniae]|uniref:N-acetyltransferase domain-containing protein n=1 Tax=Nocardioides daphniae TaxID=402297 RepID=A0ABQ1QG48_9ACTN|nr:GNAT family N-acetyltransferase [Nocardioides daphniae]GGD25966.1 hypothetical protein GCM10007231_26720 [Nocardioides daphniae]